MKFQKQLALLLVFACLIVTAGCGAAPSPVPSETHASPAPAVTATPEPTEQIAETLSSVAVKEIIGVVLAYAIKSVLENLSKNNHWPDKPDLIAPAAEEETADQPSNDL